MCGRFAVTLPHDAMAQLFAAAPANDLPDVPNYNVCPATNIHVVTPGESGRQLVAMRWGFVPHWYKDLRDGPLLINARGETVAEKPAFRAACRERRCLVPANGFYEWTKAADGAKLPWFIHLQDNAPFAFAGIWQSWDKGEAPLRSVAIVTSAAGEAMSAIHKREPVIVPRESWGLWLGEEGKGAAPLMRAAPEGQWQFHRVDPAVNSNRASGEQLIAPLAEPGARDS